MICQCPVLTGICSHAQCQTSPNTVAVSHTQIYYNLQVRHLFSFKGHNEDVYL